MSKPVRPTIRQTILSSTIRGTLRGYGLGGGAPAVAPVFSGTIPAQDWTVDEAITPLDVSSYFGSPSPAPTYNVAVGALPAGLSLNTSSGVISGTPTSVTTGSFTIGCTNIAGSDNSNSVGWTVAAVAPDFHALTFDPDTYEMLGVKTGTGDLTTTHTSTLYAPDFEGVQRSFAANEPVWSGGRVVKNVALKSDNLTSGGGWSLNNCTTTPGQPDPIGGNTAWRLATTGGSGGNIQQTVSSPTLSDDYTISIWVKRSSGTGTVWILAPDVTLIDITSTLSDGQWHRFSVTSKPRSSNQLAYVQVQLANPISNLVDIWHPQLENVSGQANQNPGEYVPTTTAPATKTFASTNGNTVTSNVVTEAVGTPLAEMPYLQYYPAATNALAYSNNLTSWYTNTGAITTFDQVGLTGKPNTASTLERPAGATKAYLLVGNSGQSNTGTYKVYGRSYSGVASCVQILQTGANPYVTFDFTNGAIVGSAGLVASEIFSDGQGGYVGLAEFNTGMTGRFYPFGNIPTDVAAPPNDLPGGPIISNAEFHDGKTIAEVRGLGPIFTTTAAVATDLTEYYYYFNVAAPWIEADPDFKNTDAAYYLETDHSMCVGITGSLFVHSFRSGSLGGHPRVVNPSASNNAYSNFTDDSQTNRFVTFAATNSTVPMKFGFAGSGVDFSARSSQIGWQDGAQNFSGFIPTTSTLNWSNPSPAYGIGPMKVRNLQRYDITTVQEGKDIIDDLMGP